jgi:VWFA-related protein
LPTVVVRTLALLFALGWLGIAPHAIPAAPGKEKNSSAQTEPPTPGIIKSEANNVLVNVIVTDRRRHYLQDLNQQDFHVFEDGVEQPIASLCRAVDTQPGAPEHERYLVLLFDNSEMNGASQVKDRADVEKFVEGPASPNRMTAIMDFNGSLHIDQRFTANGDLLKSAVSKIQFGAIGTPARQQEYNIVVSNLLRAIRDVANMLGRAPGHKTLVFVSAGFTLDVGQESEFQDTIDALNKADVGLYPINSVNITPSIASMAGSPGTGRQGGGRGGAGRGGGPPGGHAVKSQHK